MLLKIAVLAYIIFYYGGILLLRSYLLYKKTGIQAIQHLHKEGITWFNQKLLITCAILIPFIGLNYVLLPNNYLLLVPIPYLVSDIISFLGILLSTGGLILGFIAKTGRLSKTATLQILLT